MRPGDDGIPETPSPRRAVQICVVGGTSFSTGDSMYALANDGTMWWCDVGREGWGQLPLLPQPEAESE